MFIDFELGIPLLVCALQLVAAAFNFKEYKDGFSTSPILFLFNLICALGFALWALYLWLRRSEKGRAFFKKIHLYRNDKEGKDE